MINNYHSPSYWKRASAVWIDFVMLLGAYLIMGFITEHLFRQDAYPPRHAMQLYSERDFQVYWFFVRWTIILTSAYLLICYTFFRATLGQIVVGIRLIHKSNRPLNTKNILLRTLTVVFTLLILMIPGPVAALLFILIGAELFNLSFSLALLLLTAVGLIYLSFSRYQKGHTRSLKDKLSSTMMIDIKDIGKQNSY